MSGWFDPRKLLANANFQDVPDVSVDAAPIDPALAETPATTAGPATSGGLPVGDALNPAAAPAAAPGASAGLTSADMGMFGQMAGAPFTDFEGGYGADLSAPDPGTAGPSAGGYDPTTDSYPGITGTGASTTPASSTTPTRDPDYGYAAEGAKLVSGTPGPSGGTAAGAAANSAASGGGGGAAGANAMTQLANAMRGVAQAAQGGNPQAQQLMNMLRQMAMQQQMQQMGGMGGAYNPYMNQMIDPRMRMEMMRREFMRRQMLRRRQAAAAGHPVAPAAGHIGGGSHGRR